MKIYKFINADRKIDKNFANNKYTFNLINLLLNAFYLKKSNIKIQLYIYD